MASFLSIITKHLYGSWASLWLVWVAATLAGLYGLVVCVRRWLYDRGFLASYRAPLWVISVGGLEAGGTGKTPVAGWLLRALLDAQKHPGLLTRGYKRSSVGLSIRVLNTPPDPDTLGDEAAMLVASGLNIPVAACAKRKDAVVPMIQEGCDCLVLDDGFSHRSLVRDCDIVVLLPFTTLFVLMYHSTVVPDTRPSLFSVDTSAVTLIPLDLGCVVAFAGDVKLILYTPLTVMSVEFVTESCNPDFVTFM